ncbi:hypothetical protein EYF80_045666 [Liparis tanakae]|uniref:Uncharacterized protein n=1 Tax=Liparis tanakae TaxID=230148 RepID=A0A4Z2FSD4_9TELE|nr:hypothetical protein EYF80_045666 [Liparis tanakae]
MQAELRLQGLRPLTVRTSSDRALSFFCLFTREAAAAVAPPREENPGLREENPGLREENPRLQEENPGLRGFSSTWNQEVEERRYRRLEEYVVCMTGV